MTLKILWAFFLSFGLISCQTINSSKSANEVPEIDEETSLEEAIEIASQYGGRSIGEAKKYIAKKQKFREARKLLEDQMKDNHDKMPALVLVNSVKLYKSITLKVPVDLFESLLNSKKNLTRQLAWNLAAGFPSSSISSSIERIITQSIVKGEEEKILTPAMAKAVNTNNINSVYSFIREGLMKNGDDEFARTMISLNPRRATIDFLDYLGLATAEELRQINQSTVNLYSCILILNHMQQYPPPYNHPQFGYLYLYAVSRNLSLAPLANKVLEAKYVAAREYLALVLSRMPTWVQMAYVETAGRNLTTIKSNFLSELARLTIHEDVKKEIADLK